MKLIFRPGEINQSAMPSHISPIVVDRYVTGLGQPTQKRVKNEKSQDTAGNYADDVY